MKVIHFCLSCTFVDGRLYQENELVRQHVAQGHDVRVVASTESHDSAGWVNYIDPGPYRGGEGADVLRLPYSNFVPHPIARKIRKHPGVTGILEEFAPDVIVFHGGAGFELLTVSRFVAKRPGTIFHIDSHGDSVNSGRNWVSKYILHRMYYGPILRRAMRNSGPLLCVSYSVMEYAHREYRIPKDRLEFFPLGGRIVPDEEREKARAQHRARLALSDEDIALVQSGKFDRKKKLAESLVAFSKVTDSRLRFFVAGVLKDDVRRECEALIAADSRVQFLGWQSSDEMTQLLCAADVYLQPGTQSATMQQSLCCGCPVILDSAPSHEFYVHENGWLVDDERSIELAIREVCTANLSAMRDSSLRFAKAHLDYAVLAKRLLLAN